jgi:hypothetical protein
MSKISKTINEQMEASILVVSNQKLGEEPIVAVNWFNLKSKLLYSIYNLLALPLARSVGARPLFKGYRLCDLAGSKEMSREVLLLVQYPSPQQFLHLLSKKSFLLISLLRIKSVRDFNFGFIRSLKHKFTAKDHHKYLVCHFQGPQSTMDLTQIQELCSQHNCQLFYFGKKIASLSINRKGRKTKVPFDMQELFMVSSEHLESLINFSRDPETMKFQDQNNSSYLGIFSRVR